MNIEKCFHTKNPDYKKDKNGNKNPLINIDEMKISDEEITGKNEPGLKKTKSKTRSKRLGNEIFISFLIGVALLSVAALLYLLLKQ